MKGPPSILVLLLLAPSNPRSFPGKAAAEVAATAADASIESGAGGARRSADEAPAEPPSAAFPAAAAAAGRCPADRCRLGPGGGRGRSRPSVYRHGGSAMAYKPGALTKRDVCDAAVGDERRYKVASWPLRRSAPSGAASASAPRVKFRGRIWACRGDEGEGEGGSEPGGGEGCPALPLPPDALDGATVEAWQPRPDGTYSSLAPGRDEGECRASLPRLTSHSFEFDTVAPGSAGALGGLGPSGADLPPYGPPTLHVLIRSPGYETLLVDVEVPPPDGRTFRGGDWTGAGMVGAGPRSEPGGADGAAARYEATAGEDGRIVVEADFFLAPKSSEEDDSGGGEERSVEEELCQSWLYGLRPKSFFTEPIAVCAPSLLDYFDL